MWITLVRSFLDVISACVFLVGADDGETDFVERMFIFVLRISPFAVAVRIPTLFPQPKSLTLRSMR